MQKFTIFSDSSADLSKEILKKFDLKIIPFSVSFDGETYLRENIDISQEEFYKKIISENIIPKTSLPSIDTYINSFEPCLKNGLDILCICISSTISGSYQSAINAKTILEEKYPNRKIIIIDSLNGSLSQGLLVIQALEMKENNFKIDEITEKLNLLKHTTDVYFIPDTLEYLKKGGRISKISTLLGNLLNVKPILYFPNGSVDVKSKIRGKNKAISELISYLCELDNINNYEISVGYTYDITLAKTLAEKIEQKFNISLNLPIFSVGVTIGSHVGPNAIGLAVVKKYNNVK